jgi:hypothetical protein
MVFGALFAVTGVILLVYSKASGANRIRMFSLEFELSTPALVVFIAGCGLLVAPLAFPGGTRPTSQPASSGTATHDAVRTRPAEQPRATGVITCRHGQKFGLEILRPIVADDTLRVPVRIRNLDPNAKATIIASRLNLIDQSGLQRQPVREEWNPPFEISPLAFYEGFLLIRINPSDPITAMTVSTVPNGACGVLAARVGL